MEQFSLDKWLQDKSRKVVTRTGEPVEIIDYKAKGEYCVYAKATWQDGETFNICTTSNGEAYKGEETAYDLFFADDIDSLQEEPASEDLEEEIERWIKEKHFIFTEIDEIIETGHHFAHWQHGKDFDDLLQSEMKFPKEYYERGRADAMKEMKETLQTEYEKGRFDMREEMMKDAVEGCSVIFLSDNKNWLQIPGANLVKALESFKQGDKVKIIIVKED